MLPKNLASAQQQVEIAARRGYKYGIITAQDWGFRVFEAVQTVCPLGNRHADAQQSVRLVHLLEHL
jgi:hypothetical protein